MRAFALRTIGAVRILARDGRIPRPLRWVAAFGLLPIPGPLDETALLLVGLFLWIFYRERLAEAWRAAGANSGASPGSRGWRSR
jgi:hypothetical protein